MIKENKGNKFRRAFDFAHEHIIIIIIVVVVLAGLISTVAIVKGDASPNTSETTEATTTYEKMNTVYLAMDEVASLEPLGSQDRDVYYLAQLIYSSLFRLDKNLGLQKDLVDTYNVDTAGGSVSLKLREDAKFSDGSAVTASDVRYTILQIQRLGSDSPYYHDVAKIRSVSATGSRTLTITFESPSDAALDNLIFPVVDESSYDSGSNKNIGSGPYCYSSYDRVKCLKLKPNKNYYGETAVNKLELRIVPDKSKTTGLMTMDAVTAYEMCIRDSNSNRTTSFVRSTFDKHGGNLGTPGCVSYMFSRKGVLIIEKTDDIDEDALMEAALEAGADDMITEEDSFTIYTDPGVYPDVYQALAGAGYEFVESDVEMVPSMESAPKDEHDIKSLRKLIDILEDNDDVQKVHTNCGIDLYEE